MEPTIYLFFDGDCLPAMRRYADVLGGRIEGVFRNADAPDPQSRMPGGDDLVMNMSLRLGSATIMASDAPADWYRTPQGFRVHIETTSRAEFDRVFDALGADAREVAMPPGETFWAERFAMFTDSYGTPWMLSFTGEKAAG
ncbi:VOC family protein [Salinarimonas chemoclinalis]|uniref:VOC family protein n=1 Tax=Salinarimonas chemoclinalis TaxID=3241599 RepID=UPI003556E0A2